MTVESESFVKFAAEKGWNHRRVFFPEMEDEDGDIIGGFEMLHIFKWIEVDGQQHVFSQNCIAVEDFPEAWGTMVDLAEAGLARYLGELTE